MVARWSASFQRTPAKQLKQQREVMKKVGRNERCPCGSGIKFKRCHGGVNSVAHPERDFYNLTATRVSTCLAGDPGSCRQSAIRAHSIQNSAVMGLLAEDGHVIEIRARGTPPKMKMKKIGRNRASTFTGLCAKHDDEIFRPIDTEQLDLTNPRHLFLLAYRAVFREQHVLRRNLEVFRRASSLPHLAERARPDYFEDIAQRFAQYRSRYFDRALVSGDFSNFVSWTAKLNTSSATVAVSSLFSLDRKTRPDGDIARAALSVVPLSQDTSAAIVTCVSDDFALVRPEIAAIFDAEPDGLALRLSRLVLETSENLVLRPGFVDRWSPRKEKVVLGAAGHLDALSSIALNPELMLFDEYHEGSPA